MATEKKIKVENHSYKRNYRGPSTLTVSIETTKGWTPLQLSADENLLALLADLSEDRRKAILDSLFKWYAQKRAISKKRQRGVQSGGKKTAWDTARMMGPVFLAWADQQENRTTTIYKRIVSRLRKEEFASMSSKLIAAYLVRLAIENFGDPWPGSDPCLNTNAFFRNVYKKGSDIEDNVFHGPGMLSEFLGARSRKSRSITEVLRDPDNTQLIIEAILSGEKLGVGGPSLEETFIQTSY